MKKSTSVLLAAVALIFTPLTTLAQDNQQNLQINQNAAAGFGEGNLINQQGFQENNQTQIGIDAYGYTQPSSQRSVQDNSHDASAVDDSNVINQGTYQGNDQLNGNVDEATSYPDCFLCY
jgi:hypothetical protein